MEDIYGEIIIENSRFKANKKKIEGIEEKGINPSCGDQISITLSIKDGIIKDAGFQGEGCAISEASANIFCKNVKGMNVEEVEDMIEMYVAMIKGEKEDESQLIEVLGDAYAFKNIANMPSRVKCALLAWKTGENIIKNI